MSKRKKTIIRLVAVVIAVLMPIITATAAMAVNENTGNDTMNIKYLSPDINSLTGHGEDPEEISVSATAHYAEKKWYEYVTYSENAVASYRIDDNNRVLFYDPYTYTNAMVMDVQFDATTTEFDTMSSYSISHTTSKTMSATDSSTYTSSTATQSSGRDLTGSNVTNSGSIVTRYNHTTETNDDGGRSETKNYGTQITDDETVVTTETIHDNLTVQTGIAEGLVGLTTVEAGLDVTFTQNWGTIKTKTDGTGSITTTDPSKTTTDYKGEDTVEHNTESATEGWSELSDRITKTIGSSRSTSTSWSETESTTVTKTYAATHFASDGVTPLPWAIVHYTVEMPMKCSVQYKYEGEWITVATTYCMLTTIKGTCRAWIENGQVYYEDWGSGSPVVATDFWSQFMTKEQLVNAYQNKLYPVGGVD